MCNFEYLQMNRIAIIFSGQIKTINTKQINTIKMKNIILITVVR